MKFTDGVWRAKPGMKLHVAKKPWEYAVESDGVRVMTPCHTIHSASDTTRGPVLVFRFTAPREDMIRVRIEHFTGGLDRAPSFELHEQPTTPRVEADGDIIRMHSGKLSVEMNLADDFAYRFVYDGRPLTGNQAGGTAYVTARDYEADQAANFNHLKPPVGYMQETYVREQLTLGVGTCVYGLGEHFTPVVKNGQSVESWNRDGGTRSEQAYKNVPFYLTNDGYGVLVNTPDYVDFEVGTESVRAVQFSVEGEALEYIVIGASEPKYVLEQYTALTGRARILPPWSFGLWLSSSWMGESNERITYEFVDGMRERGIPLSVFHFDARWMDDFRDTDFVWSKRYGDVRAMLQRIHDSGVKVCVWINPYVSQMSRLFEEGKRGGYFIKNQDGGVWQTDVWMPGMAIVDFTNPEACAWYTGRLGEILDMGVDCVKTDFGERIPTNVVYHDGSDPQRMHNYYPYLYNKTIFEYLERVRGVGDACVFARSATVGTQQFPVHWGGDNLCSYVSMAETLRGGLSFCLSGFGFWSHDISGFFGTATPDLYKRWAAFGLLSTHSRLHGKASYRVPWCFDEESCDVLGHFARLKCSLMPYLYEGAMNVHLHGQPEMRAMMLDFPNDPTCLHLDRQYMLGERLLVAPVFDESGSVTFYVPAGRWTDYQTGEEFVGGQWFTRAYDYFHLPLLARPGSIIARGDIDMRPDYDFARGATYQLFALGEGEEARCDLFDATGAPATHAEARREGNVVYFTLTGRDAALPWRLQLRGVRAATAEGAATCADSLGVLLTPEPGVTALSVRV